MEARPGTEAAPWRDVYGWHETRRDAMHDSVEGWSNYKRSTVVVPETLTLPEYVVNIVVVRGVADGEITGFLEWVDEFGDPQRIKVDGRVISRIQAQSKQLQKENRSRSGKHAAWNRRLDAVEANRTDGDDL
jgi:hypothetical protein